MAKSDFEGKTVMIAEGVENAPLLSSLKSALEKQGANVVMSKYSPSEPDNLPLIAAEIARHEPKIDALIAHNPDKANFLSESAARDLQRALKDTLPVIVVEGQNLSGVSIISKAKASYYENFNGVPEDKILFAVSDAIAQHGRPRRLVGI